MRAVLEDIDISELKAVGATAISLDLRDAFIAGEVFVANARYPDGTDPLKGTLCDLETAQVTEVEFAEQGGDGWQSASVSGLVAGTSNSR